MNVVITMIRDEQDLAVDFVVHHLSIGFDRIIIFDDQSETRVVDLLAPLPETLRDRVDVHELDYEFYRLGDQRPPQLCDDELYERMRDSKQMYFLNYALRHFVQSADWIALVDADEFIWLPSSDIKSLRSEIEHQGFTGIILDWLNYGHGFHLVRPQPSNLASFLWRATALHGEGKYFGSAEVLVDINSPHYPGGRGRLCDAFFEFRAGLHSERGWTAEDIKSRPHIKHYMIRDLMSYLCKMSRGRIATIEAVDADSSYWNDRLKLVSSSTEILDIAFAMEIIKTREHAGLSTADHWAALRNARARAFDATGLAGFIDFAALRAAHPHLSSLSESRMLLQLLRSGRLEPQHLRFAALPDDFDVASYQSLNPDLRNMNDQQLRNHYARHGRIEKRNYLRVQSR